MRKEIIQIRISRTAVKKLDAFRKNFPTRLTLGQVADIAIESWALSPPLVEIGKAEKGRGQ